MEIDLATAATTASTTASTNSAPIKDTPIRSWWKKVTHNSANNKQVSSQKQVYAEDQVFGVPLEDSLKCARAAIAYVDNDVQYVGFIPVIVAKCGSFLKDQGLYTEGVFRMSGSAKRIGKLQQIFNTAPDYGRQLDWKGFSVHDAANVLRRFLNYLPEPVITHNLYQPFKDVLLEDAADTTTEEEKVAQYQNLIEQLPESHQYLLFYLLDLLSLFTQNVQITKMDSFNLASVFTPGILMNPDYNLSPAHYKSSQKVVQFLVEHQHCFKMPRSSWFTVLNQQDQQQLPQHPTNEQQPSQDIPFTPPQKPLPATPVPNNLFDYSGMDNNTISAPEPITVTASGNNDTRGAIDTNPMINTSADNTNDSTASEHAVNLPTRHHSHPSRNASQHITDNSVVDPSRMANLPSSSPPSSPFASMNQNSYNNTTINSTSTTSSPATTTTTTTTTSTITPTITTVTTETASASNTPTVATTRLSSSILSPPVGGGKDQRVKRAKTMPSRRSRYGPHDPVQIVKLNKSTAGTPPHLHHLHHHPGSDRGRYPQRF
ncbi:Rho GTPase activation protein [Mycotypha africana]|uniref:Rho GTPase activation protein n=1 Tax=Mycotypha africana TaxID=64632 RepID=UPI002300ED89|nr:Rho GTPase activation protein [Mycotypha africana]KAI8973519.1 Rho GTPase activation protein [Mycotypha africana]